MYENRILYDFFTAAMMIDDDDLLYDVQKIRTCGQTRLVSIHDNQKVLFCRYALCIFLVYEIVAVFLFGHLIRHRDGIASVDDDIYRLSAVFRHARDSQRCTESVHIRHGMTHHKNIRRLVYQLSQSQSHDPGFSLVALFHGLQFSAVILEI